MSDRWRFFREAAVSLGKTQPDLDLIILKYALQHAVGDLPVDRFGDDQVDAQRIVDIVRKGGDLF